MIALLHHSSPNRIHHESGKSANGFTIVELLMAMAVSAILMLSLVSIISKSTDVSKRANTGMLSKSSAQAALDLMVTDLDSLLVNRNAGQVFLYTNQQVPNAATNLIASTIYILTTSMEDSYSTNNSGNSGCPRLVQYVLQYTTNPASITTNSFGLWRNVVDPTNTFQIAIGTTNISTNSISSTNYNNNLLVPNVVGMNVAMYTNYGTSNWVTGGITNNSISTTNFPPGVVLEISLTVLDEPALSRFGNGDGTGNNSATNLINQFGRTLVRRVSLPSPP